MSHVFFLLCSVYVILCLTRRERQYFLLEAANMQEHVSSLTGIAVWVCVLIYSAALACYCSYHVSPQKFYTCVHTIIYFNKVYIQA